MRKRMRNSEGCSFGLSSHNMQLALLCATHQVSEVQWQPYYMCHTLMHIKLFTSSVLRPSLFISAFSEVSFDYDLPSM